jgi:hypothetical protein
MTSQSRNLRSGLAYTREPSPSDASDASCSSRCHLADEGTALLPFFDVVLCLIAPYQFANACSPCIGDVQLSRTRTARGEKLSQTVKPIFPGKLS